MSCWQCERAAIDCFACRMREASEKEKNMLNKYGVGAVGRKIHIALPPPNGTLTARDAMEFAAWLVASACPMLPGSASDELGKFHKLIADAAEGTDLEGAALEALEDD